MILLHNPINIKDIKPTVLPYAFSSDLLRDIEEAGGSQGLSEEEDSFQEEEDQEGQGQEYLNKQLLLEAQETAEKIIEEAKIKAEEIEMIAKQNGYEDGFQEGSSQGKEIALEENRQKLEYEAKLFLNDLQSSITDFQRKKDELVTKHYEQLCQMVLAIAEKVIDVSLKSSAEIIKKMILSATEKSRNKEWAKIHISNYDADLMVQGEVDIFDAVKQISPHISIDIMENAQSGTCIIEFPDQIIDASSATQLENIKEIFNENRFYGGI